MPDYKNDPRIVMTLDAGGTSFRFSAMRGGKSVTETITLPSNGDNLDLCLGNLVEGFNKVLRVCPEKPSAISFAFPGPADYPEGIIGDLHNLPAFRGGIALGEMLKAKFGVPVFINNDGDLFAYGEAISGFLPYVNDLLEKASSHRRHKNLFGITLGTGLGGGIVRDGELFVGDNSTAGEVHLMRNKLDPKWSAEEGACIRAVRRTYGELAEIPFEQTPDPHVIAQIAEGTVAGNREAAAQAYRRMGEVVGDVMANALTLIDGLAVIGGGISKAWHLFLPALIEELNGNYSDPEGGEFRRLSSAAFNLEDENQLAKFLKGDSRWINVPGSDRKLKYDPMPRFGVGISRLGTSEAVAIGAYAFALQKLDS